MTPTREQVLEQCKQAVAASDANGLQVLALIAGVIRQVAPSSAVEPLPVEPERPVEPVAVPETSSAPSSPVETLPVAPSPVAPETSVASSPVAVPEAVEPPSAPERSTYRLVLNVPEINDYKG